MLKSVLQYHSILHIAEISFLKFQLWMGTHSKGPSIIDYPPELKGLPLSKWLLENKWSLGDAVCNEFCGELPFLFKVYQMNHLACNFNEPRYYQSIKLSQFKPIPLRTMPRFSMMNILIITQIQITNQRWS